MSRRRQRAEKVDARTVLAQRKLSASDQMHAACGEHVDLVVDHVAKMDFCGDVRYKIMRIQMGEQEDNLKHLMFRPLQRTLLNRYANCDCSPFNRLKIRSYVTSGSAAEGIYPPPTLPNHQSSSDTDFMVELGPIAWTFSDTEEAGTDSGVGLADQEGDPVPRLAIVETENPGYVLLLQERRDDCPHPGKLRFEPEAAREFLHFYICLSSTKDISNLRRNGPAISYVIETDKPFDTREFDEVPCLHVPVWWFSDEFFTRHRRHDWPPEAVRTKIKQFGLHLVPVGAAGSNTEEHEWRLSFSMAEVLIVSLLTEIQKCVVIAFKLCQKALGEEGKSVKSYFAKTALLWLCEQTQEDDWTSVTQGLLMLLDFLDDAVRRGRLPCFFWSEINLLRLVNQTVKRNMQQTLGEMRGNMSRFLFQHCVTIGNLKAAMPPGDRRLSEYQVRVSLVRLQIIHTVTDSIRQYRAMTTGKQLNAFIHVLLRTYSSDEVTSMFRRLRHWCVVQKGLFQALTVAPDDVTSQVRLSDSGDGGFVWDAAPLLALLTDEDMEELLGNPDAVRGWLRRQHRRPKAKRLPGLPADLRSPRDLCDLLLNIPLLCWALRESVPGKWSDYCQHVEKFQMVVTRYKGHRVITSMGHRSFMEAFRALPENICKMPELDHRVFGSFIEELGKSLGDAEKYAAIWMLRCVLPDYWDVWHLVLSLCR